MIEVRKLKEKEKKKHPNMKFVIDFPHSDHFFTENALNELSKKIENILMESKRNNIFQNVPDYGFKINFYPSPLQRRGEAMLMIHPDDLPDEQKQSYYKNRNQLIKGEEKNGNR